MSGARGEGGVGEGSSLESPQTRRAAEGRGGASRERTRERAHARQADDVVEDRGGHDHLRRGGVQDSGALEDCGGRWVASVRGAVFASCCDAHEREVEGGTPTPPAERYMPGRKER